MDAKALLKHERYFERHLVFFPVQYQQYDSSHTSLLYFCLTGLSLLGKPLDPALIDWIWERRTTGGFKGSLTHTDGDFNSASTYFCLAMLAMLKAPLLPGLKQELKHSIQKCQLPNGSFTGSLYNGKPCAESSLRYMYSCLGSLYLIGEEIDTKMAVQYALSCQNYDGGFGDFPGSESHAGLTYCALVSIIMFSKQQLDPIVKQGVVNYLLHCQQENGGFNGRVNKDTDTCYSFWVTASLKVLDELDCDIGKAREYLYNCQHQIGGFFKVEGEFPDPLHSTLGLCALSILNDTRLVTINAGLCIPAEAAEFSKQWH